MGKTWFEVKFRLNSDIVHTERIFFEGGVAEDVKEWTLNIWGEFLHETDLKVISVKVLKNEPTPKADFLDKFIEWTSVDGNNIPLIPIHYDFLAPEISELWAARIAKLNDFLKELKAEKEG